MPRISFFYNFPIWVGICGRVSSKIYNFQSFQFQLFLAQILLSYPIFGAFSSWTYRVQVFVFLFLCLISTFWPFWEIPCFNSWAYLHKYFQMQKYIILRDISCILNYWRYVKISSISNLWEYPNISNSGVRHVTRRGRWVHICPCPSLPLLTVLCTLCTVSSAQFYVPNAHCTVHIDQSSLHSAQWVVFIT